MENLQEVLRKIVSEEISKALSLVKPESDLLSRKQAAEYLGIKSNTLAVWAVKGIGPAPIKIGRRVMYKRIGLNEYANLNTMPR